MPSDAVLLADNPAAGVLRLRLNRPERRNALDRALVTALLRAFDEPGHRAVVLCSTDPAAFCAGADLTLTSGERAEVSDLLYGLYERMVAYPAPIVAAVDGPAVGGGAQLAIASDIRLVGRNASFRFAGAGHGLAVGAWGLPSLVGRGRALELCLTMRDLSAAEALELGLADRVEDEPDAASVALAAEIAELDPEAVSRIKRVVAEAATLLPALALERAGNRAWSGSTAGSARPR